MTSLKNISHLFLTRVQKRHGRAAPPAESGSRPLHSILVAGLCSQLAANNFSSSLSKALARRAGSVFLLNVGHKQINSPLLLRYAHHGNGNGEARVETVIDSFRLGELFEHVHDSLSKNSLLMISDAREAGGDFPREYLDIVDDVILLTSPDIECRKVCSLVRFMLRSHPDVSIKLCITEAGPSAAAQQIYNRVVQSLADIPEAETRVAFLGHLPSAGQPQQVVLGDRVIHLARPDTVRSAEQSFGSMAENLLQSLESRTAGLSSHEVFHTLNGLLVNNYPELFTSR